MAGLTDNTGGLNFTTGLEFQTGMGAPGLVIITTPVVPDELYWSADQLFWGSDDLQW